MNTSAPRRRNRDRSERLSGSTSAFVSTQGTNSQPALAPTRVNPVEQTLRGEHRWLRFPPRLEAMFQIDVADYRRTLLIACALIGALGYWMGSANDTLIAPDLSRQLTTIRPVFMASILASIVVMLMLPRRARSNWVFEACTALNALLLTLTTAWIASTSQALTAVTHSMVSFQIVMFVGIAARLRFWWTLAVALLSFAAYALMVRSRTPLEALVVVHNAKIMTLAMGFTLLANYVFEHRERRLWLLRKLETQQRESLEHARDRLRELAARDSLTGLYNRRHFDAELERACQAGGPLGLLMLDVDFFKLYNDTYGHPAGDACLQAVAQVLQDAARDHGGLAARLGGEEFVLLLPSRDQAQTKAIGEQLCHAVRAAKLEHRASAVAPHVTISVGGALRGERSDPAPDTATMLVTRADRALYHAKKSGRDRVCLDALDSSALAAEPAASAPPMQADESAASATPQGDAWHDAAATLARGFRWLAFPSALERRFQDQRAAARRRHLLGATIIGVLLLNGFLWSSRSMYANLPDTYTWPLIGVSALMLVGMFGLHLTRQRSWMLDAGFTVGASALTLLAAHWLSAGHEARNLSAAVMFVLVPFFCSVAARLSFWWACVLAAAALVGLDWFSAQGTLEQLILTDTRLMVGGGTLYTLIAAYSLEHGERKQWLLSYIEQQQTRALAAATEHLHQLSSLDPLTGLANRRQFEADLTRLWRDASDRRQPLALLILDVDLFKAYNDHYGHPAGDRCLRHVAAVLADVARSEGAHAARLGGEEFGLLLPRRGPHDALRVGECMCVAMREAGIEHQASTVAAHVTISVGVASVSPQAGINRRMLLAAADDALYIAKTTGRDRVATCASPAAVEPPPSAPAELLTT